MKQSTKLGIGIGVAGLALLVVADLTGLLGRPKPAAAPDDGLPPEARSPGLAAAFPKGDAWKTYLKQEPLVAGKTFPALKLTDHNGGTVRLPDASRPTLVTLLCGCTNCAQTGKTVSTLKASMKTPYRSVVVVSNSSKYVWDRMTESYGKQHEMIWDPEAKVFSQLRAPGKEWRPDAMVWGLAPGGRIVYFHRPYSYDELWIPKALKALGFKERPSYLPAT